MPGVAAARPEAACPLPRAADRLGCRACRPSCRPASSCGQPSWTACPSAPGRLQVGGPAGCTRLQASASFALTARPRMLTPAARSPAQRPCAAPPSTQGARRARSPGTAAPPACQRLQRQPIDLADHAAALHANCETGIRVLARRGLQGPGRPESADRDPQRGLDALAAHHSSQTPSSWCRAVPLLGSSVQMTEPAWGRWAARTWHCA